MTVRAPASKLPDTGTTIFTIMSRLAEQHSAVKPVAGLPGLRSARPSVRARHRSAGPVDGISMRPWQA